jgi:MoxR-like ATPase
MVVATQNPVDMDGTYPLPEAQLDRFLMRLSVGYPARDAAVDILRGHVSGTQSFDQLRPAATPEVVRSLVTASYDVYVADSIHDYIVRLTEATRAEDDVRLGASPRGSLALVRAAQVEAASWGRNYVLPEDVQALAAPVLAHRLLLTPDAELRGFTPAAVIHQVVGQEAVPQAAAMP